MFTTLKDSVQIQQHFNYGAFNNIATGSKNTCAVVQHVFKCWGSIKDDLLDVPNIDFESEIKSILSN